ncbi:MAG TPA: PEP-CTERM sorting domain-containing protein [Thiobacillus sp.]|nr:PEP-CTERM sorting domain-containing protein [Thiobacillus sp.]
MKHTTIRRSLIAMLSVASLLAAPSVMASILTVMSSGQNQATISPAPTAAYVDFGALYVNGAMTLDASTPLFHFTTLEMAEGSTLSFSNLMAGDTLQLIASEAVRIRGELQFAPASNLSIEAPLLELGSGSVIRAPGGSVPRVGGRDSNGVRPIIEPGAGSALTLLPGAFIDLSAAGTGLPGQSIRLGEGGVVQLADGSLHPSAVIVTGGGVVALRAPVSVPEPGTLAILLTGLAGWAAVRRRPLC